MRKEFVTYRIALKLKKLGFDEKCFGHWHISSKRFKLIDGPLFSNTSYTGSKDFLATAPLWQQAWSFLLNRLEEKYFLISYKVYSDGSVDVSWCGEDNFIREKNQEKAILKMIELCEK